MTTELEMLAWAVALTLLMWIPYILAHIANVGLMAALTYKADASPLPAWAARAKKAHYNAIENLAPFAALVVIAHLAQISNDATQAAAVAYFWFRAAHFVLYISGLPFARTLTFAGSWLAQICILYQILWAG
ncbi:MAG: MAPEG family protein [Rhodospirillales bacterium]|nr:MAPEG family protein [Rhodospirillales bacterium]